MNISLAFNPVGPWFMLGNEFIQGGEHDQGESTCAMDRRGEFKGSGPVYVLSPSRYNLNIGMRLQPLPLVCNPGRSSLAPNTEIFS